MTNGKKLSKSNKNKMICGVCGGYAEFFNIDVTIVRIIAVLLVLIKGLGIFIYLVSAIIMPSSMLEEEVETENLENMKSANIDESTSENKTKSKAKKQASKVRRENQPHSDEEFEAYFK